MQDNKDFNQRVKAGRKGELIVTSELESLGLLVHNLNDNQQDTFPPVDLEVSKPLLYVEVKVRLARQKIDLWLPARQIPQMQQWQADHSAPVLIAFVFQFVGSIEYALLDNINIIGYSKTGVTAYIEDKFTRDLNSLVRIN